MGCPDWPGCYGGISPISTTDLVESYSKAWIEMLHRYFALIIGLLITGITVLTWCNYKYRKQRYFVTGIFFLLLLQGAFGAFTVTMKLDPSIVTIHLLLGLSLFAALTWLVSTCNHANYQFFSTTTNKINKILFLGKITLIVVFIQIALGGWVSSNYAVLACNDFPLCNGQWLPQMNFQEGFAISNKFLSVDADLGFMSFNKSRQALIAIHWTHRVFALFVSLTISVLIYFGLKIPAISRLSQLLFLGLILQLCTGISNIIFGWPILNALTHNAGAAFLIFLLVKINYILNNGLIFK